MPSEKKIVEHKPYGWWYTPKNKSFEDRYFIGYKESVASIRQTLIEQVKARCKNVFFFTKNSDDRAHLMVFWGFHKVLALLQF